MSSPPFIGRGGFNWYVDQISGSDSNTGTSPSQAFATIAKLLTKTIAIGQSIGLKTGSYWREQLNIPAANITVQAYGGNAVPEMVSGTWSKTMGASNVYQITLATVGFVRAWEGSHALASGGNYPMYYRPSIASVDTLPGSFYVDGSILYVQATDSTSPAVNGKPYLWSNPPMLDCADIIPPTGIGANTWSKTGGLTNVYQITVNFPVDSVSNAWANMWENGLILSYQASAATCDSVPGSFYFTASYGTSQTLYVNASGSSKNPSSNGQLYEYSQRSFGLDSYTRQYVSVVGVATGRNKANDGSMRLGQFGYAKDTYHWYGAKHNCYFRTGSSLLNCVGQDSYYAGFSAETFIGNDDSPNNEGLTLTNCQAITLASGMECFNNHVNVGGSFGAVTYTDCYAETIGVAFNSPTEATGNNSKGASQHLVVTTGGSFTGGTAYNCTAVAFTCDSGGGDVQLGNLSVNGPSATCALISFMAGPATCEVTGCIYDVPYSGVTFNYMAEINSSGEQPGIFTFTGNTVYGHGTANRRLFAFNVSPGSIVSNNNIFISQGASWQWKLVSTFYNQAQWLALGYDANSVFM